MKSGLKLVGVLVGLILFAVLVNTWWKNATVDAICPSTTASAPSAGAIPAGAGTSTNPASMVKISQGDQACLNSRFEVVLSGAFAQEASESHKADGPGFTKKFTLYLNDVPMTGLEPPLHLATTSDTMRLNFKLNRNSHNDENRKSWNSLLSGIEIGSNRVSMGLSFNGGVIHESANALLYSTRPARVIWVVVGVGVIILLGGMWTLIEWTSILRDDGPGTPYSLGKTQMAVWGLLVMLSFVGVLIVSGQMERIPEQSLMLLGISSATGLLSLMVAAEKDPAARAKSNTGTWLRDIISDDKGPSFHRLQVVIWTGILAVVFAWTVASTFSMPEFDNTLLLLLGISNGTYLGFKLQNA